ncbi:hypothetical protein [Agrococcus casei]
MGSFLEKIRYSPGIVKTMDTRENPGLTVLRQVIPSTMRTEAVGGSLSIIVGEHEHILAPVWVGEGYPSDVQRALPGIRSGTADGVTPVVTGRRISIGSRQLLDDEDVSWADSAGFASIHTASGFLLSRLEPAKRRAERRPRWSASVAAAAEVILETHRREGAGANARLASIAEIADAARLSYSSTAKALTDFDEAGYTEKVGASRGPTAGRALRDPGALLSDWAARQSMNAGDRVQLHVPWREPQRSLELLNDVIGDSEWAVSGAVAAEQIAPFLTQTVDLRAYIAQGELHEIRRMLTAVPDVREVRSGGRIMLKTAEPHLFALAERSGGVPVAPAVRVYADLVHRGGRLEEAAEHLREVAIGF